LHLRGGTDHGVPVQQGQGKQQPGEELAGHVAGQGVFSRRQAASYGENAVLLLIEDALLVEQLEVGPLGPLHQPAMAGEHAASSYRQGNGNEMPQGGTALPAVQAGQVPAGELSSADAGDGEGTGGGLLPASPQGGDAPQRGLTVLGEGDVMKGALPLRQ